MTVDELLDAIGEIDDSDIKLAEEKPKRRKPMWTGIGALAACLLFVLFVPNVFLRRLSLENGADYVSKDYTSFLVYYAQGETLSSFPYEIHGGYTEMFFAWKNQNRIGSEVALIDCVLNPDSDSKYILHITISASFSDYLEKDQNGLLLESLKKTVASYTGSEIKEIELSLSE